MLPEVDLLPKYERSESVLYKVFIVGCILLFVSIGGLGYLYVQTKIQLDEVESTVASLNEKKTVLETEIHLSNTEVMATQHVLNYIEQYQTPSSFLVDEVVGLLPEHGYLSEFTYDYHSIQMKTQFETLPDSSIYTADLLELKHLEDIRIDEINSLPDVFIEEELDSAYDVIPGFEVFYSIHVKHQSVLGEEEENETSITGE